MGVESTPACSAKLRSVVESTLKKRTPLNDCCMRRKCGSILRQELQNLAVMKTTASPATLSGDVGTSSTSISSSQSPLSRASSRTSKLTAPGEGASKSIPKRFRVSPSAGQPSASPYASAASPIAKDATALIGLKNSS